MIYHHKCEVKFCRYFAKCPFPVPCGYCIAVNQHAELKAKVAKLEFDIGWMKENEAERALEDRRGEMGT